MVDARDSPALVISFVQVLASTSIEFKFLQSETELVIAIAVSPSYSPADMISAVHEDPLSLDAQSSTAFETSLVAFARSVAALLIS